MQRNDNYIQYYISQNKLNNAPCNILNNEKMSAYFRKTCSILRVNKIINCTQVKLCFTFVKRQLISFKYLFKYFAVALKAYLDQTSLIGLLP